MKLVEITERKQTEELLKQGEQKYRELAESISDVFFAMDSEFRYVYWNKASEELTGIAANDAIGKHLYDIFPRNEMTRAAHRVYSKVLKTKQPECFVTEYKIGDKDYVFEISAYPSKDGLSVFVKDITRRRQVEEELRKSDHMLRLISENSRDIICLHDSDHRYVYISPACKQILGYDPEELIGTNPWELVHPQDLEELQKIAREKALKGDPALLIYRIRKKCGEYIWFESTSQLLTDDKGNSLGFVTSSRDVTERKQAEKQIERSAESLTKAMENTIEAMAMIVEMRDPYTAGHQRRVTQLACAIAKGMGLTEDRITGLRLAGLIHDIGKIRIPTEILTHPNGLSEAEFNMIKVHPLVGHEILQTIESPWPIADIVYQHHERMNGSGYPSGITGNETILEARILAVADVVEAMSSHRPYRPSRGLDKALEEISENRGVLYDPQVVDTCLKLFREQQFAFK